MARPHLESGAASGDQILHEHAVWLTGQFGGLAFVSLKSNCKLYTECVASSPSKAEILYVPLSHERVPMDRAPY